MKGLQALIVLATSLASFGIVTNSLAQNEVAKGSELRKQLFELARPAIERETGESVLFQGSMRQLDGWVFFSGTVVDADGHTIQIGPAESGDTAILWTNRDGDWVAVEAHVGFTDVIYLEWPKIYGFSQALVGS